MLPGGKHFRAQIALSIVEGPERVLVTGQAHGRLGVEAASDASETSYGASVVSRQVSLEAIVVFPAVDFAASRMKQDYLVYQKFSVFQLLPHFLVFKISNRCTQTITGSQEPP